VLLLLLLESAAVLLESVVVLVVESVVLLVESAVLLVALAVLGGLGETGEGSRNPKTPLGEHPCLEHPLRL
jgi:hypothetical protein